MYTRVHLDIRRSCCPTQGSCCEVGCTFVHMRICANTLTPTHTCKHKWFHSKCTCIYFYICTSIKYIYISAQVHIHIHVHVHIHTYIHQHTHTYIHNNNHESSQLPHSSSSHTRNLHMCVYELFQGRHEPRQLLSHLKSRACRWLRVPSHTAIFNGGLRIRISRAHSEFHDPCGAQWCTRP